MTNSIFETKKGQSKEKSLSVKLPVALHDSIEKIKASLAEKAPEKRFNVNAICVDALARATKKAAKELGGMSS